MPISESNKSTTDHIIERELEQARERLLDLTMRNRLLNFRPTKRSTIEIIDELAREVYGRLVIEEKPMQFRARSEEEKALAEPNEEQTEVDSTDWTDYQLDDVNDNHIEEDPAYTDRYLQTDLRRQDLQNRLFYIRQKAEMVLEEQGYTVLFLATGLLEWKESHDSVVTRKAPLILIPVQIERRSVGRAYTVSWTGEDIYTNVSLQAKLAEQGVKLPDFNVPEEKSAIDEYFDEVRAAVSGFGSWLVTESISLGFFSFNKFVMYRDLEPQSWPVDSRPAQHPLIRDVLAPGESGADVQVTSYDEEAVAQLTASKVYHVQDADSSQVAVIEASKAGDNLVVEGPPGTGKSQTIVNLIAELLAMGKTVLFVSEKMAALEVVKERLDRCGLVDACLELHSRHLNKRKFIEKLQQTVSVSPPMEASLSEELKTHEDLTAELNGYVAALRKPIGRMGRTPYNLFGIREKARKHFAIRNMDFPKLSLASPEDWSESQYREALNRLGDLSVLLRSTGPLSAHPWGGCEPEQILPDDVDDIKRQVTECKTALNTLVQALGRLDEVSATGKPQHVVETRQALAAAKVMANACHAERSVLLSDEWNQPSPVAEKLLSDAAFLQSEISELGNVFIADAFSTDVDGLRANFEQADKPWYRFFLPSYWRIRKRIGALYKIRRWLGTQRVLSDLDRLSRFLVLRKELAKDEEKGRKLFGDYWKGEKSDVDLLRQFALWITSFRRQVIAGYLTERAIEVVATGINKEHVAEAVRNAEQRLGTLVELRDKLVQRLSLDYSRAFGEPADEVSFATWLTKLKGWENNIDKLPHWSDWIRARSETNATVASPLIEWVEQDRLGGTDLIPGVEGNLADSLLAVAFGQCPALERFVADLHERKISSFVELDEEIIRRNRQRLARRLWEMRPKLLGGATRHSEAGILLGQISRKRGHLPIRQLMKHVGRLIQGLKPCFMMSPLSVAQFLDPHVCKFDVIVFDEASQVRPEDAIGALLRGSQLIVMGDTNQLPPTSFFDRIVMEEEYSDDEENEECDTSVTEVESILHQCKRSFPVKRLRWHYRSRHESLIAVSNQEFYENSLLIYPSSVDKAPELGLELVHLPDTVYDRGKSSTNRMEARAVIQAAITHYRRFPHKSLGVGTFGIKQQQAIYDELEMQLRQNPDLEEFFSRNRAEHFFVKNLETIQGDERDVIFISVGYGFDSNGKLTMHFGPVNREGGERRLNVLITRAREKCVVFSNFRAQDMSIKEGASFGLRALKTFLDYAENRNLASTSKALEETESPFEDAVYEFLRSHGHEVRKQVGCAEFRVDLAVVDPRAPGKYVLAVECDGAKYHSAPVARDRDRLRQMVLERLGWRIHRIWSTDWYRNRTQAERRLLAAIESALRADHSLNNPTSIPIPEVENPPADYIERKSDVVLEQSSPISLIESVPPYTKCSVLDVAGYGELHEYPPRYMAKAIENIVRIEGPVHFDEVVNRIRSAWGIGRAGSRIKQAIRWGVNHAIREGLIEEKGCFLWSAGQTDIPLRRRTGRPPAKIEYICDEEISEAVRTVLKAQFATEHSELANQAARLLGFQAVHSFTFERVKSVIVGMVDSGELMILKNDMVDFAV